MNQVDGKHYELKPIFILDPWIVKKMKVGPNRWRFLQESLLDLDVKLRTIGTRLHVLRGKPEDIFPRIFSEWHVKKLTFELDIEPYARERDDLVEKLARKAGVSVVQKVSHTLYDTEKIIRANMGKPPLTYQKFLSVAEGLGTPSKPVAAPADLPEDCKSRIDSKDVNEYSIPSLAELGVDESTLGPSLFHGGETQALERLEKFMSRKAWVCKFEKPNTSPNSLEPSTTVLSPYLKFGCLSARTFYYKLKEGKTGYPFIDAIMTQLREEGWIHHLARHVVACFLTRGDLWISWEEGKKVFEELLLDADWALNAGNWMWLSASAFFHQFFRVYSPVAFGKKTDKFGDYIKKYIPKLRKMPSEYIYEPWKAPLSVQKQAGCIVGVDYPKRIVVHEDVYKTNIKRMSDAYKCNKKIGSGESSKREQEEQTIPIRKKQRTSGKKPRKSCIK